MYQQKTVMVMLVLMMLLGVAWCKIYTAIENEAITMVCDGASATSHVEWKDLVYNMDENEMLIYDSDNNPTFSISNKHPHKTDYMVDSSTYALTIKNARVGTDSNAGLYKCYVDGQPQRHDLSVIGSFHCDSSVSDPLRVYDVAIFTCTMSYTGTDIPKVQWLNKAGVVQDHIDDSEILKVIHRLELTGTPELDEEVYTCRFSRDTVTKECSLDLSVLYNTTTIDIVPKKNKYQINEEVECSANGNPAPTIQWSVADGETEMTHGKGWRTIRIPESWANSEHTLTCSAYNVIDGKDSLQLEEHVTFQVTSFTTSEPTQAKPIEGEPSKVNNKPLAAESAPDSGQDTTPKAASSNAGVIGGVIAAVIVVIVIVAIILVVKKRNKKPQGSKPLPTADEDEKKTEKNGPQKGSNPSDSNGNHTNSIPDYSSPNSLNYVEVDFSGPPRNPPGSQSKPRNDDHVTYSDVLYT